MQRPSLLDIFLAFLRVGATAFGGPAMIPYIRTMAVDRKAWIAESDFRLGMAVAQLIPGATAMQTAAYVGLRSRGGLGGLVAYLGFGLPPFLLILGLSALYFATRDVPVAAAAFSGLQLIVTALVLNAAVNFARRYLDSLVAKLLACSVGVWLGLGGNPILALVIVCALAVVLFRDEAAPPPQDHAAAPKSSYAAPLAFVGFLALLMAALHLFAPHLVDLALLMVKIDLFAFGGGYVSVPIMLHEVVEVRGWLTQAQFMDGIALGQVTPGPMVMTGVFVGYAVHGLPGATLAAVCVYVPSLIMLSGAAPVAKSLAASPIAQRVLKGSLVSLVGLIAAVAARFLLAIPPNPAEIAVALAAFLAFRLGCDPLRVIVVGAGLSMVVL